MLPQSFSSKYIIGLLFDIFQTMITRKNIIINHTLSAITLTIYFPILKSSRDLESSTLIKSRSYQPGPRGGVPYARPPTFCTESEDPPSPIGTGIKVCCIQ